MASTFNLANHSSISQFAQDGFSVERSKNISDSKSDDSMVSVPDDRGDAALFAAPPLNHSSEFFLVYFAFRVFYLSSVTCERRAENEVELASTHIASVVQKDEVWAELQVITPSVRGAIHSVILEIHSSTTGC